MSFGNKVGRVLGTAGALIVEGSVRGATGLGQFGADLVEGTEQGYAEKHAALLVSREAARIATEKRRAAALAAHTAALAAKPEADPAPVVVKRGKVALS